MKNHIILWAAALVFIACTPKIVPEKTEEKDNTVHVTGVAVTRADLELNVGEGFHLGVRVTPKNATNPRVTWSTDNASVATVEKESGQVKAVGAGNAGITDIVQKQGELRFTLKDFDMEKVSLLYARPEYKGKLRVEAGSKPCLSLKIKSKKNVIDEAREFALAWGGNGQERSTA